MLVGFCVGVTLNFRRRMTFLLYPKREAIAGETDETQKDRCSARSDEDRDPEFDR
jgi:hypothetical protein